MSQLEQAVQEYDCAAAEVTWLLQHDNEPGWKERLQRAVKERWQAVRFLAKHATIVYSPPKGRS